MKIQQPHRVGFRNGKLRSALVMSEMALTLVLVIGAALLIRTFMKLRRSIRDFDTAMYLTMAMSISGDRFQKTAPVAQVVQDGTDRAHGCAGRDRRGRDATACRWPAALA